MSPTHSAAAAVEEVMGSGSGVHERLSHVKRHAWLAKPMAWQAARFENAPTPETIVRDLSSSVQSPSLIGDSVGDEMSIITWPRFTRAIIRRANVLITRGDGLYLE